MQDEPSIFSLITKALNVKFSVKLSNIGNPDHGEDPERPVPGTITGYAKVDSLAEAYKICRQYIEWYELGGGNWTGGEITDEHGVMVGHVSFNGRVWDTKGKEIAV